MRYNKHLPKRAIIPRAPDVHAPPPETACSSDFHNYVCHKLDWHLHKTTTQSGLWALHTRNIRRLNTDLAVNYRSLLGALEKRGWNIRPEITLFTRWRYFTAQRLSRWWTCLAQLSSTIMMLHVTGICRRITMCTIYQHTLSFYLPPPEFCHRGPTKQPPTTSLREIRQMSSRRVCVCVCGSADISLKSWPAHRLQSQAKEKIRSPMWVCRSV